VDAVSRQGLKTIVQEALITAMLALAVHGSRKVSFSTVMRINR